MTQNKGVQKRKLSDIYYNPRKLTRFHNYFYKESGLSSLKYLFKCINLLETEMIY